MACMGSDMSSAPALSRRIRLGCCLPPDIYKHARNTRSLGKRGAQVRALQGGGWQADAGRFRTYAAAVLGLAGAQVRPPVKTNGWPVSPVRGVGPTCSTD